MTEPTLDDGTGYRTRKGAINSWNRRAIDKAMEESK